LKSSPAFLLKPYCAYRKLQSVRRPRIGAQFSGGAASRHECEGLAELTSARTTPSYRSSMPVAPSQAAIVTIATNEAAMPNLDQSPAPASQTGTTLEYSASVRARLPSHSMYPTPSQTSSTHERRGHRPLKWVAYNAGGTRARNATVSGCRPSPGTRLWRHEPQNSQSIRFPHSSCTDRTETGSCKTQNNSSLH